MTKLLDKEFVEVIREKSRKKTEQWLDEITKEGESTGDYNTVLTVYLSAAKYLLDRVEEAVKTGGGNMIAYPDHKNMPKVGN